MIVAKAVKSAPERPSTAPAKAVRSNKPTAPQPIQAGSTAPKPVKRPMTSGGPVRKPAGNSLAPAAGKKTNGLFLFFFIF